MEPFKPMGGNEKKEKAKKKKEVVPNGNIIWADEKTTQNNQGHDDRGNKVCDELEGWDPGFKNESSKKN